MRRTAEAEAPGATVEAQISGEAFLTPAGPLYQLITEAIRNETGVEPALSTSGGTSDGRFLIELCPVVDFGLPNATMHKLDEAASEEDIRALAADLCPDRQGRAGIDVMGEASGAVLRLGPGQEGVLRHRSDSGEALQGVAAQAAEHLHLVLPLGAGGDRLAA